MKILAVIPFYPPTSMVGAWLATHECLRSLPARGHEVTVISGSADRKPYRHDGLRVLGRDEGTNARYAEADVVVSHLGDGGKAARTARRHRKPVVRMVHSAGGGEKALLARDGRPALAVFPSQAAADLVGFDGPQVVVHPPFHPADYKVESLGAEVTLVNLSAPKGGKLFWRLAAELPHLPFLGVRGGYGTQVVSDLPNVAVMPPVTDMRRVYRRTRVLLMPSLTESWGRCAIEACVSGIPVVAHPSPGLQEALGGAGTWVDRDDLDGWVEAIRSLAMPSVLRSARTRARARVRQLDPEADLTRFAEALEALCP